MTVTLGPCPDCGRHWAVPDVLKDDLEGEVVWQCPKDYEILGRRFKR